LDTSVGKFQKKSLTQTLLTVFLSFSNIPSIDECMSETMINTKNGFCNNKRADSAIEFIESMRSDSLTFLCKNYNPEENDICDKYIVEPNYSLPNYKFYFLPLIKSLTNSFLRTSSNYGSFFI